MDDRELRAVLEGLQAPLGEFFRPLQQRLDEMEKDQRSQARTLQQAIGRNKDPKKENEDQLWPCSKCKSRLGFYNKERDVLRSSYHGHIVHCRLGVSGYLSVICMECGEVNTLEYEPPAGSPPIKEGVLRLSTEALEKLLEQAKASQDGAIEVSLDAP